MLLFFFYSLLKHKKVGIWIVCVCACICVWVHACVALYKCSGAHTCRFGNRDGWTSGVCIYHSPYCFEVRSRTEPKFTVVSRLANQQALPIPMSQSCCCRQPQSCQGFTQGIQTQFLMLENQTILLTEPAEQHLYTLQNKDQINNES